MNADIVFYALSAWVLAALAVVLFVHGARDPE
jgi:hypothetical protein